MKIGDRVFIEVIIHEKCEDINGISYKAHIYQKTASSVPDILEIKLKEGFNNIKEK